MQKIMIFKTFFKKSGKSLLSFSLFYTDILKKHKIFNFTSFFYVQCNNKYKSIWVTLQRSQSKLLPNPKITKPYFFHKNNNDSTVPCSLHSTLQFCQWPCCRFTTLKGFIPKPQCVLALLPFLPAPAGRAGSLVQLQRHNPLWLIAPRNHRESNQKSGIMQRPGSEKN